MASWQPFLVPGDEDYWRTLSTIAKQPRQGLAYGGEMLEEGVSKGAGGIASIAALMGHPGVAIGATVVSAIANMIGAQKAKEEAERERRKQEALQRAAWMSERRAQTWGRYM